MIVPHNINSNIMSKKTNLQEVQSIGQATRIMLDITGISEILGQKNPHSEKEVEDALETFNNCSRHENFINGFYPELIKMTGHISVGYKANNALLFLEQYIAPNEMFGEAIFDLIESSFGYKTELLSSISDTGIRNPSTFITDLKFLTQDQNQKKSVTHKKFNVA